MRTFVIILLSVIFTALPISSQEKKVYHMGEKYGVDSSKISHRSFPKKLVMPKGAFGGTIQTLWLKMSASDVQALTLVSGATGSLSYFRIAPAFCWAYANNNALGVRLIYNKFNIHSDSGTIRILTEDFKFDLKGVDGRMNSFGTSIFNRSWFGLDDKGRIALFVDADLHYIYSDLRGTDTKAITNQVGLTFSPGLEIFVWNNFSCFFSLSFANLSYSKSKCYEWKTEEKKNASYWAHKGSSSSFNAQVRFNVLDFNFGLALYF